MKFKPLLYLFLFFFFSINSSAQSNNYRDSIRSFIDSYIKTHEVVLGTERQWLRFFPVDENYRVQCVFEPVENSRWFKMETSGPVKKMYRIYGIAHFTLHDTLLKLNIYQSQSLMETKEYRDYLFIPFTDLTSGNESYEGGRYFDFKNSDILNKKFELDFNKAYNPYCAYVSNRYSCPIPPKENNLPLAIRAGEKVFGKKH
jgi:uncharacterized protein (DUF1684 family)